jgi:hypothetical protein
MHTGEREKRVIVKKVDNISPRPQASGYPSAGRSLRLPASDPVKKHLYFPFMA